jgi:hypothetical protein
MNIGIQCALAKNKKSFPVGGNLREYALSSDCEGLWGLYGFSQFIPNGPWNLVLFRNEDSNPVPNPAAIWLFGSVITGVGAD